MKSKKSIDQLSTYETFLHYLFIISRIIVRGLHMFFIGMLHIILGFMVAVINTFIFPSMSQIQQDYTNPDGTYDDKIYGVVVGWILLEVFVLVHEIYLIRNIVKLIGDLITRQVLSHERYSFNSRYDYTNTHSKNSSKSSNKLLASYNNNKSFRELIYSEYSNNIMLGYVVYLFSFGLNDRIYFLVQQVNPNAKDPLENAFESHVRTFDNHVKTHSN